LSRICLRPTLWSTSCENVSARSSGSEDQGWQYIAVDAPLVVARFGPPPTRSR
jgi:hypothetical protein